MRCFRVIVGASLVVSLALSVVSPGDSGDPDTSEKIKADLEKAEMSYHRELTKRNEDAYKQFIDSLEKFKTRLENRGELAEAKHIANQIASRREARKLLLERLGEGEAKRP